MLISTVYREYAAQLSEDVLNKELDCSEGGLHCRMSSIITEWSSRKLGLALGLKPQEVERIHQNRTNATSDATRQVV